MYKRQTTEWSFRNGGNRTRLISAVRRPVPGRCTSAELSRIMTWMSARTVSYTHLDVYKRQLYFLGLLKKVKRLRDNSKPSVTTRKALRDG